MSNTNWPAQQLSGLALRSIENRQAHIEWITWHQVCHQLKALKVDINTEKALHRALVLWGEELAALRALQEPAIVAEALTEARELYLPHCIEV